MCLTQCLSTTIGTTRQGLAQFASMGRLWYLAVVNIVASGAEARDGVSATSCASDIDCSLNGLCNPSGKCVCDKPWQGPSCGVMGYKVTPVSGKDLFPINRSHNTWNVR